MNILVGYNGFVGSNILRQMNFDYLYNSKNINDAFNTKPDLCIYAGVKSMKFYANKNPLEDYNHILETIENIKKINPKRLILISTIDVFDILEKVDEKHQIKDDNLQPYGKNRRILEKWVEKNIESYNIVRLPALYGKGLKKNFLFDLMNPIPNTLSKKLFEKLSEKNDLIKSSYILFDTYFYILKESLTGSDKEELLNSIFNLNFTSKQLTDSRASYQFYPLSRIGNDLRKIIEKDISCIQLVTEPINTSEIHEYLFGESFINHLSSEYPTYNLITSHAFNWNRFNGYIMDKSEVLVDIKKFLFSQNIYS